MGGNSGGSYSNVEIHDLLNEHAKEKPKTNVPVFGSEMNCQSDGGNRLKRMSIEFYGHIYHFKVNPEDMVQTEPNRVTATQTKGGAFIDDFGGGIQTVTLKGTTGWKVGTEQYNKGFAKFKELRDLIRKYYFNLPPGTEITKNKEMIWHNYTDGEHWVVVPKVFKLLRSVSRPLLYAYDIEFILERPATLPKYKDSDLNSFLNKHEVVGK